MTKKFTFPARIGFSPTKTMANGAVNTSSFYGAAIIACGIFYARHHRNKSA